MKILLERTRLVFTEYSDEEKLMIRDLVGTINHEYCYIDEELQRISIPLGMADDIKKIFPEAKITDNTSSYEPFQRFDIEEPVAQPRNQMQIDFIKFALDHADKKEKIAGILPPGAGKALPVSTKIPMANHDIYLEMGQLKVGMQILGSDGSTTITGVFPQGEREILRVTLVDGRVALCDREHLWTVKDVKTGCWETVTTEFLMTTDNIDRFYIKQLSKPVSQYVTIVDRSKGLLVCAKSIDERHKLIQQIFDEIAVVHFDDKGTYCIKYTDDSSFGMDISKSIADVLRSLAYLVIEKGGSLYIYNETHKLMSLFKHSPEKYKFNSHDKVQYFDPDFTCIKIKTIEYSHKEEAVCIKVDAEDELFIMNDYILTHNTFMGSYCALKVGARTLIIPPTNGIRPQWADTFTGMFGIDPSRVCVTKNATEFINTKADFVISSHPQLYYMAKNLDLAKVIKDKKFGIKIIDEAHMWFKNIIVVDSCCNICHNWYMTGTFGRSSSEENALYRKMFGDIKLFEVPNKKPTIFNKNPGDIYGQKPHVHVFMAWTRSEMSTEDRKRVGSMAVYAKRTSEWMHMGVSLPLHTNICIPPDGTMTKYLQTVLGIIDEAINKIDYGKTLILFPTNAACAIVAEHLRKRYPDLSIGTYNSLNSNTENTKNKTDCDILISTEKSAGTGFDMPGLSRLIVGSQMKSWILQTQVFGRLRIRPDGKDTYLWDIVDAAFKQLAGWANLRADLYERHCKTFVCEDR